MFMHAFADQGICILFYRFGYKPNLLTYISNIQVRVDDKGASNEIWLDIMGKHNGRDGKLCLQVPHRDAIVMTFLTGV